jgi:SAM-dependent methyltransferase
VIEGSILSLPYEDNSVDSLSCLHVIEHIGLGRYGDPVDIHGSNKSAKELSRVLSKGGALYLGVPIGRERVEFNAHRIFNPNSIVAMFSELELIEFKAIDDGGSFVEDVDLDDFDNADYSCGLFMFKRKK